MTDIGKLKSNVARAQAADALMNHPLIQEAFDLLDKEVVEIFRDPTSTSAKVNDARVLCIAQHRFKEFFEATLRMGDVATRELATIEKEEELRKAGLTG